MHMMTELGKEANPMVVLDEWRQGKPEARDGDKPGAKAA